MGSTAITGELIWPSQNDLYGASVGGSVGDGVMHYERQRRKAVGSVAGRNNYIISGGALPASDPDLTITIPTGAAIIEGHYCEWPATNITLPASNTSHVFVKLVFSGTLITGLEIEDNTSDTPPAASTKLGTATTSGSAVTSTTDARILGPGYSEVLTSGASYTWKAGVYRMRVRIYGASGGAGGGGEATDQAGPGSGNAGSTGGTGGSTTFGSLTADGGQGGTGGGGGTSDGASGSSGAQGADGSGSGPAGSSVVEGGGRKGRAGGSGGVGGGSFPGTGGPGGPGGPGGYVEAWVTGTPGSTTSFGIGAGGTAGAGGVGGGNGADGAAGQAGQPGRIVLDF